MSPLHEALDEYLVGSTRPRPQAASSSDGCCSGFVAFADSSGATCITTELALAWAMQPAKAQPAQWANRLAMVRRFARYCSATRPADRRTADPIFFLTDTVGHRPHTSIATKR